MLKAALEAGFPGVEQCGQAREFVSSGETRRIDVESELAETKRGAKATLTANSFTDHYQFRVTRYVVLITCVIHRAKIENSFDTSVFLARKGCQVCNPAVTAIVVWRSDEGRVMREWRTGSKVRLLGSTLLFTIPLMFTAAEASQPEARAGIAPNPAALSGTRSIRQSAVTKVSQSAQMSGFSGKRGATRSFGISCVPYARQVSGIMVVGNAWQWWEKASGQYARGDRPEVGSVLNFRPNTRMRLGHVAVVSKIINPREVVIDHANWPIGGRLGAVSHDVAVVDVSEANNWSAVRVELDRDGTFGSVYPTYGFIYNRPDTGVILASVTRPAPQADINPVPSDLRPVAERPWRMVEEVAESRPSPARRVEARAGSTGTRPGR